MTTDIALCNNKYCEEYKDNTCRRSVLHKEAVKRNEKWVSYIPNRNCEKQCELFLEVQR